MLHAYVETQRKCLRRVWQTLLHGLVTKIPAIWGLAVWDSMRSGWGQAGDTIGAWGGSRTPTGHGPKGF